MGILTWIILGLVAVGGIWVAYENGIFDLGTSYDGMSTNTLATYAMDWDYEDLERNPNTNNGNVIFIQGVVSWVDTDRNRIIICEKSVTTITNDYGFVSPKLSCDRMAIEISNNSMCFMPIRNCPECKSIPVICDTIPKDNQISGYVETDGLTSSEGWTVPKVIIIKLQTWK